MTDLVKLSLGAAPNDPVERIAWLDGVLEVFENEISSHYEKAYFEARMQGRFDAAVGVGRTSRKQALAMTRRVNNRMGQSVRWGDGLDRTSSAYSD